MSLTRSAGIRNVAAGGVLALAAGSLGAFALAGPATAASGALNYTCTHPVAGSHTVSVVADTNAPESVAAGKSFTPTLTATVTVPDTLRNVLYTVGARSVEGTAAIKHGVAGVEKTVNATVPATTVPDSGEFKVVATGVGEAVTPTAAGELAITAGDFTTVLNGKTETGEASPLSPYQLTCTLVPGQDVTVDKVTVTAPEEVASTTKVQKVKVNKAKRAVIKVKVASSETVKGKVKIVVKKGKKKVQTKNVKVNAKGVAKLKTKKLAKGKYKVNAKYLGKGAVKASKGKGKFQVK